MGEGKRMSTPKRTDIDAAVGSAVKRLRRDRGLTVTGLSLEAGISQAMISRIEQGQVSPSLSTLAALAQAMLVPVMALLAQEDEIADVHHVRAGQGLASRRMTAGHAHEYLLLGKHGGPGGSFQSSRIKIKRDQSGDLPRYQHEGYVFIYLLEGRARYQCGTEVFELLAGDTLSFDAKLAHGFEYIESLTVEFISVSTRPN